jgi:hypothetical protein
LGYLEDKILDWNPRKPNLLSEFSNKKETKEKKTKDKKNGKRRNRL